MESWRSSHHLDLNHWSPSSSSRATLSFMYGYFRWMVRYLFQWYELPHTCLFSPFLWNFDIIWIIRCDSFVSLYFFRFTDSHVGFIHPSFSCVESYCQYFFPNIIQPAIPPPTHIQCISNCFTLQPLPAKHTWHTAYQQDSDTKFSSIISHLMLYLINRQSSTSRQLIVQLLHVINLGFLNVASYIMNNFILLTNIFVVCSPSFPSPQDL